MSVEEGFQLTEASVIKKAKAVAKGKVTKNINLLNITLSQDEDERFIFYKIDENMVSEANSNLHSSYDTFKELHERHVVHADFEEDKDEREYAKNIADAFSPAREGI